MAVLREYLEATLDLRIHDADFTTFLASIIATKGTWTPADASGAALSLTILDARYWKLGTLVIASARIVYPATASGANSLIGGLPFALDGNESSRQGHVSYANVAAVSLAFLPLSGTQGEFRNAVVGTNVTNATLSGATVIFQTIYQTT